MHERIHTEKLYMDASLHTWVQIGHQLFGHSTECFWWGRRSNYMENRTFNIIELFLEVYCFATALNMGVGLWTDNNELANIDLN